uniref:Uncharacterized protein n=1 Tax=Glossina austeni TaxID=7395 RepID=A0A1A9UEC7_GLOAU
MNEVHLYNCFSIGFSKHLKASCSKLRERVSTIRRFPQLLGACISLVSINYFLILGLKKERGRPCKYFSTLKCYEYDPESVLLDNHFQSTMKITVKLWPVMKNHVVGQASD